MTALQTIVSRHGEHHRGAGGGDRWPLHRRQPLEHRARVRWNSKAPCARSTKTVRKDIHDRVRAIATNYAEAAGATAKVEFGLGYPVTINDPALTERMVPTLRRAAGADNVRVGPLTGTAEDFSFFQQKVPGLFLFLGVTPRDQDYTKAPQNHSPLFFADESALPVGVKVHDEPRARLPVWREVMNRRSFISTTSVGVAGLALARNTFALQQPAAAPPVTRFEDLRRGVGMFIGTGGTIGYLVNGAGAVAIDSQFMNTAEIALAGLKQRAPKGIEMLLNTHHHGDHTGGNQAFAAPCNDRRPRQLPEVAQGRDRRSQDGRTAGVRRHARSPIVDGRSSATRRSQAATTAPATPAATRCSTSRAPTSCTWATCSSTARIPTSIARRRPRRQLDHRAREGGQARTRTTPSSSPATPRTTSSAVHQGRTCCTSAIT